MNGYQNNEKCTARHARKVRNYNLKGVFSTIALLVLPMQASAIGYLTCILPENQVAVSDKLDARFATKCFSEHLEEIFGATANYYQMETAHAKSNLESAKANVAIMRPERYNAIGFDLAVVVTAFGELEEMKLESGYNFQELAMVSAMKDGGTIVVSHEMGEPPFVQALRNYNFAALSMAEGQLVQHFHMVGINCQ